ncbi:hypothetical protein IH922_00675 [candidate division KSB1 bacterium]|nr:hypothetical protein [candidate division KSB1 bacterium]
MQINIDGMMGIIKTAGGGRCLVDFNHPLSGKEVTYTIKVNKIITDDKEKLTIKKVLIESYVEGIYVNRDSMAVKKGFTRTF